MVEKKPRNKVHTRFNKRVFCKYAGKKENYTRMKHQTVTIVEHVERPCIKYIHCFSSA